MISKNKKFTVFAAIILFLSFFGMAKNAGAANASMYLFPPSGTNTVGNVFNVYVKIDSSDKEINAAEGTLVYNPKELEVVSVAKSGSFFTLWTKDPSFSNATGKIDFGGGSQKASSGSGQTVMVITFRPKISATSQVNFSSGSVLAADGLGTNVLGTMQGGIYTSAVKNTNLEISKETTQKKESTGLVKIGTEPSLGSPQAPEITSLSHPDPNKWYNNKNAEFSWAAQENLAGVRYEFNSDLVSLPGLALTPAAGPKIIEGIGDGIWYFHLQFKNQQGWGSIGHKKIMIDTAPPETFAVNIDNKNDPANPSPSLEFKAVDKTSGISAYEIKIDQKEPIKINPDASGAGKWQTGILDVGRHTVIVKAIDMAGNYTLSMADINIDPLPCPAITEFPKSFSEGDYLSFSGTSDYPGGEMDIYVKDDDKEAKKQKNEIGGDGNWSFTCNNKLAAGNYQVWFSVTDKRGARTLECGKTNFIVNAPFVIKIGRIAINYLMVFIIFFMLLLLLVAMIVIAWRWLVLWRKKLKKETREANEAVAKAFRLLRDQVQEEIISLDNFDKVTDREIEIRDHLQNSLNAAEKIISKEINDIEKEIS